MRKLILPLLAVLLTCCSPPSGSVIGRNLIPGGHQSGRYGMRYVAPIYQLHIRNDASVPPRTFWISVSRDSFDLYQVGDLYP